MTLWLTGDPTADQLLTDDPFALLIGMLLDQQVTMESAFAGPAKIAARMDGLDVHRSAEADPETFAALCATPPAVHRYPGSMAGRIQAVAAAVVEDYDGDVTRLWTAGGVAHRAANVSGSASAMRWTSSPSMRAAILAGPANADSMVTCWSRSIPMSRANGSSVRSWSAVGSPVSQRVMTASSREWGRMRRCDGSWWCP